jgi:hypothetical protein
MKGRVVVYVLAAAAGIALALPFDRPEPASPDDSAGTREGGTQGVRPLAYHGSPTANAAPAPVSRSTVPTSPKVYANQGLELEPLYAEEAFVGYLVVRSHDPRLSVGDVITGVGGHQVEEGAAGSELLIAALRNPQADLTVQQRTDWSPES